VISDLNGAASASRAPRRRRLVVNQWVKKAVLLSFRLTENKLTHAGDLSYFDKGRPSSRA